MYLKVVQEQLNEVGVDYVFKKHVGFIIFEFELFNHAEFLANQLQVEDIELTVRFGLDFYLDQGNDDVSGEEMLADVGLE